jgi:hypothetical protein
VPTADGHNPDWLDEIVEQNTPKAKSKRAK